MGNKLARTTQASPSEYYLQDLPSSFNLVLKEVVSGGRFLKSVLCVHDEGLLLVKVYFKRGDHPDLKDYERKLLDIREKLQDIEHSHVWPFQHWLETDKAAYLLRQYFFSNLHDRISTRPFLSLIEKKWIAFQLLHALKQSHERGVCHGDIKCENVLVTSWNWAYLTDYASFKPTYLPVDNPSDFSFFFDTGGRRRCYLAPERFYDPTNDSVVLTDAPLRPAMDIFSLGCVIAELFLEGHALFDLSQLLAYRRGQYDPRPSLNKISDVGIQDMILQMVHLNPESRLSADEYLRTSHSIFPGYFSPTLHDLFSCLSVLDCDTRVAVTQHAFPEVRKQMIAENRSSSHVMEQGAPKLFSDNSNIPGSRLEANDGSSFQGFTSSKLVPTDENLDLISGINALLLDHARHVPCILEKNGPRQHHLLDSGCCRAKAASIAMAEAPSAVENTVTEEAFESQVRRLDGTYGEVMLGAEAHGSLLGQKKEDVVLPIEGGWSWDDEWEIDFSWSSTDGEGWRYGNGTAGEINVKFTDGFRGNTLRLEPDPRQEIRQRRWVRKRTRRNPVICLPSSYSVARSDSRELQNMKCEGMVLIASLLCACLRNVRLPQARRGGVQILYEASKYCDDDARLQHIVPFVAALLLDPAAMVRCAALQTLCDVLSMVQTIPPSDAKLFPEYILPLLSMLPDDPEESVRICYADCIHKISKTSFHFLLCSHNMNNSTSHLQKMPFEKSRVPGLSTGTIPHQHGRYDMELHHLRESIARVIHELVMGPKQTPTIRRALLQHIGEICSFFGKKQSNDFLLPILPAFLNDRDEQLRAIFFEYIVYVCIFVGQMSSEAYLFPYIEQALNDVEETVIVNALECVTVLCVRRLLRKRMLLKTVENAAPLLCHPGQWVRRAAVTFVTATGSSLEPVDSYAYLSPILSPFLRREPVSMSSEAALLACLKPPFSREVFDRFLSDVMMLETSPEKRSKGRLRVPVQTIPEYSPSSSKSDIDKEAKSRYTSSDASLHQTVRNKHFIYTSEPDDKERMKAMEGYLRTLSSAMQSQMYSQVENNDKQEISAVGFSPDMGIGSDGSPDNFPLYSVPVSERKHENSSGQAQPNQSVNEEWNRIFGARQGTVPFLTATVNGGVFGGSLDGTASSQWATIPSASESLNRSSLMLGSFPPRLMTASVYSGVPLGTRRFQDSSRDMNRRDNEQAFTGSISVLSSKPKASITDIGGSKYLSTASGATRSFLVPEASGSTGVSWRPRGVLIAHLEEHQQAVNSVAVSSDNVFLASASNDGTVKIWDCRRLERDVSFKSRLTYTLQNERALCVTVLGGDHQVAVGSNSGAIHVFTVDYIARPAGSAERYAGISNVRKVDSQGGVLGLQTFSVDGPQMMLYSTQRNGIHLWDLRVHSDVWMLKLRPEDGFVSAFAADPCGNWLVSGTKRGMLTLWDLRFQIPVHYWQHPLSFPVDSMCPLLPSGQTSSTAWPLVYIAAGMNEVALWNAEDGKCHQVLRIMTTPGEEEPFELLQGLPTSRKDGNGNNNLNNSNYRIHELNDPPPKVPGVRSLLPLPGDGSVIMGGTDCRIRIWDHQRPEHSYCICGPTSKGVMAPAKYLVKMMQGARVIQEFLPDGKMAQSMPAMATTDTAGSHRDSITSLVLAQGSQQLLISGSRDGAVKVWK